LPKKIIKDFLSLSTGQNSKMTIDEAEYILEKVYEKAMEIKSLANRDQDKSKQQIAVNKPKIETS
jgi:hypothetical protein